jgi:outer membrane murein-binding lipoprotein Lpp
MQYLLILAILIVIVLVLTGPLRRASTDAPSSEQAALTAAQSRLAELEAAREAKYREIRDAELDHRTGKLSDEDYRSLDASLRAEAVEILHELDVATIPGR